LVHHGGAPTSSEIEAELDCVSESSEERLDRLLLLMHLLRGAAGIGCSIDAARSAADVSGGSAADRSLRDTGGLRHSGGSVQSRGFSCDTTVADATTLVLAGPLSLSGGGGRWVGLAGNRSASCAGKVGGRSAST
jgi:hypothetical protein